LAKAESTNKSSSRPESTSSSSGQHLVGHPGLAGRVYLVGAGPGDPGLLTARALELIADADVILYDRLIPAQALDGARADAELLYVGKEGGGESVAQEQTLKLLIELAQAGKQVVRLKGGDPFVFGRGGEEALALRAAGIPFEVVPGVTAGVAAAAYAGIPVTHRGRASAVALVTGHEDPDKGETALDWQALAAFPGTLVFYMGIRALPYIAQSLIDAGRPAHEPAVVVERGTLPGQRTVAATLKDIAERASEQGVRAPAITIVGPVGELAQQLAWRPPGPLSGRTVAVTRARAQASGLARALAELGAEVIEAPAIRIELLPGPPPDLALYDLVCLTSPNGVAALFARLGAGAQRDAGGAGIERDAHDAEIQPGARGASLQRDARAFAHTRVAAIGPATAAALREHGILADVVPERYIAESLVQALADLPVRRALVARAKNARDVLPQALRERGAEVDVLALYETVAEPLAAHTLRAARAADYVTFSSSSTVRFFLQAVGGEAPFSATTRVVSIGPVTSETLREHGIEPHVQAERHDIEGVLAALLADARTRVSDSGGVAG
jgi:uroporphyrinogen III methyltransferase/synthase